LAWTLPGPTAPTTAAVNQQINIRFSSGMAYRWHHAMVRAEAYQFLRPAMSITAT
jgi:hypothetical protein